MKKLFFTHRPWKKRLSKRSIFALAVAVPMVSLFRFVSIDDTTTPVQIADESMESTQDPVIEDPDSEETEEGDFTGTDQIPELPPPLTYEDVYAQWLTIQSELGRLADRLTLRTNSAQEAQSSALPSERMALRAQSALSSGNLSGALELIVQTQQILDFAQGALDAPLDDPSFVSIPAQQIDDTSPPEQVALSFREKQNALNFFDQFERELMSSLSLSLLPNRKALP